MKKTYQENLSGWAKALDESGLKSHFQVEVEDKLEAIKDLIASGLQTYEYQIYDLNQFYLDTTQIKAKTSRFDNELVIRAVPINKNEQRYSSIGGSLEDAIKIFKDSIERDKEEQYKVIINEYDPARYCGVVISDPDRLMIEMADEPNLENLCHHHIIPWSAEFTERLPYSFRKMYYINVEEESIKKIMWNVVKSLCIEFNEGGIPRYVPRQGYFEFVFSEKYEKVMFIDAKEK